MEDQNQENPLILPPISLEKFLDIEIELEEEMRERSGITLPRESDLNVAKSKLRINDDDTDAKKLLEEKIKFLQATLKEAKSEADKENISTILHLYTNLDEYLKDSDSGEDN